jgi:hypothetical protein
MRHYQKLMVFNFGLALFTEILMRMMQMTSTSLAKVKQEWQQRNLESAMHKVPYNTEKTGKVVLSL